MLFNYFPCSVKGSYFPLISAMISFFAGFSILIFPSISKVIFSMSIVSSGLFLIVFSLINLRIMNLWGWYVIYGVMILIMGGYFILYADDISVPFVLGFVLLFRFTLLIGIFVDIRKLSLGWKKLILMSGMGIILSVLMILNLNNTFLPLATFICLGISSLQLSGILRKIKKYQKHQQFPIL